MSTVSLFLLFTQSKAVRSWAHGSRAHGRRKQIQMQLRHVRGWSARTSRVESLPIDDEACTADLLVPGHVANNWYKTNEWAGHHGMGCAS